MMAAALPRFDVALPPPDLSAWQQGNTGLPGVHSFAATAPGPHVGLIALVHGNEYAGAIALCRLLAAGLRPSRGRLTLGFANLAAFTRFDPANPTASRFVDEDMNRLWDPAVLDCRRQSTELDRARALRPMIDSLDVLLDLHSMLWPSEPLLLCGSTGRGRALAGAIGLPGLVVADDGHLSGRRLIDYPSFTDPAGQATALLLEAGQHWQPDSVAMTEATIALLLARLDMAQLPHPAPPASPRFAQVTRAVTAASGCFNFLRPYRGGEVVPHADTLIAMDGAAEIRTPHDECLLVMPSLRPARGHTAVRLARLLALAG